MIQTEEHYDRSAADFATHPSTSCHEALEWVESIKSPDIRAETLKELRRTDKVFGWHVAETPRIAAMFQHLYAEPLL